MLRLPGVVGGVNVVGRLAMDAFLVAPVVHLLSRLPSRLLMRIFRSMMPGAGRSTACCCGSW